MFDNLIQELDNPDSAVRANARARFLEIGADAVETLVAAMEHGNNRLSWQAARILRDIPDQRWIEPMCQALYSSNILLGQAAVEALEVVFGKDVVEIFLNALPDRRAVVQIALVNALERLQDKRSIAPLIHLLEATQNSELRYNIIQALGAIGDQSVVPLIQKFQNDSNHHVRERVEIALSRLGTQP